jgi:hypothetical protein
MVGFWNGQERRDFAYYKDVGSEANQVLLQNAFDSTKLLPLSKLRMGQDHSIIGSTLGAQSFQYSLPGSAQPSASWDQASGLSLPVPITLSSKSAKLNSRECFMLSSNPREEILVHVDCQTS